MESFSNRPFSAAAPASGYATADKMTAAAIQMLRRCKVFTSGSHSYSELVRYLAGISVQTIRRLAECSLASCVCCTLHEFCGRRATIKVSSLLDVQGRRAGLCQRIRGELDDLTQIQGFSQFLPFALPAHADIADIRGIVFELLRVRPFLLAALRDNQNVLVASGRHTGLLTDLIYLGVVCPVDGGRRVALRVTGCPRLRICLHHDPGVRAIHASDPGVSANEDPFLICFDKFDQMLNIAILVLRKKNNL